jgi:hypothetical protein
MTFLSFNIFCTFVVILLVLYPKRIVQVEEVSELGAWKNVYNQRERASERETRQEVIEKFV